MSDYDILSIICTTEAAGELDGSTSHAPKTTRKYCVHPLNQKRDEEDLFKICYSLIRKYPKIFLNITECQ